MHECPTGDDGPVPGLQRTSTEIIVFETADPELFVQHTDPVNHLGVSIKQAKSDQTIEILEQFMAMLIVPVVAKPSRPVLRGGS